MSVRLGLGKLEHTHTNTLQKETFMSSSQNLPDVGALFGAAADAGALSADTLTTLRGSNLGNQIQNALGVSADAIEASEVVLMTILLDDSGSIRFYAGNTEAVVEGTNLVVEAVTKSKSVGDVLCHVAMLNKGSWVPYTLITDVKRMTTSDLNPNGGTPLYDQAIVTLGTVMAKVQEFRNAGTPCRTVTLLVTDGNDEGSRKRASDVSKLVRDMLAQETNIIAGMGIDDGRTDFKQVFREMGLEDQWILTPSNDPSSIRRCFQLFSRSSAAATQGAASFSQAFRAGMTP